MASRGEPTAEILQAIVSSLRGRISLYADNHATIPVKFLIEENEATPYIVITQVLTNFMGTKDTNDFDCNFDLLLVDRSTSPINLCEISDQIYNILHRKEKDFDTHLHKFSTVNLYQSASSLAPLDEKERFITMSLAFNLQVRRRDNSAEAPQTAPESA